MTALRREKRQKITDWPHMFLTSKTGYINVSDRKSYGDWYSLEQLDLIKEKTQGKERQFISVNSFGIDPFSKTPRRKIINTKQIRNIPVDIDQYALNLNADDVIKAIEKLVDENKIPKPNLIQVSNGIQLFYNIEGGASPNMDWLRYIIACRFIETLKPYGADSQAKDVTRLMRVPGSINEKNGAIVEWEILDDTPYSMNELRKYTHVADYQPPKPKADDSGEVVSYKKLKFRMNWFYQTNHARIRDLELLFDLRQGNFTHQRNKLIYIYAYHHSLIYNTEKMVLESAFDLVKNIKSDASNNFSDKEVERTVSSAFEHAKKFEKKFKADGYQIKYYNDGIARPKTNKTVIDDLDISEAEQLQLNYIYSKKFKRYKEAERIRNLKGFSGTMEEYNTSRQQKKMQDAQQVAALQAQGYKQKEISEKIGKSIPTVKRLIKFYKECLTHE